MVSQVVFVDVETSPPLGTSPDPARVKAPKNYTKPETIKKYQEENAFEDWKALALDRTAAQMYIIGAGLEDGPPVVAYNAVEPVLLESFTNWYFENFPDTNPRAPRPTFVAYNGLGFDFWLLATRLLKWGITTENKQMIYLGQIIKPGLNRYPDEHHKDPFVSLGREGKLDEWADFFGIERNNPIPSSAVVDKLMRGGSRGVQECVAHCLDDIVTLRKLYNILKSGGFI